jgi:hypothetical protein
MCNEVQVKVICMILSVEQAFIVHWLLDVPQGSTVNNATFCLYIVYMCFVWISEQTATIQH